MDVEKLFQDFQNHGVCGQWKGEAPSQADVSCSLHYYSAAHQKQSFHRLYAHSTRAASDGLAPTQRTSSRARGTWLCQLLLRDIWDGSWLWRSLLVLHQGCMSFWDPHHPACLLPAAPLHFSMGLAGQILFS